jgi:ribosomal protein L3 glutamine methyltransferase
MPSATVLALVDRATARLKHAPIAFGHGIANARDEATYLVMHALKLPPSGLTPYLQRTVSARASARAMRLVDERIRRRIPAAYLTHEAWLGEYRFYVDARVIVPRSFIAELLHERLAPWLTPRQRIRRALDLCTGSGCLAIVLAKTFAAADVDGVDIDRRALAVAKRNIATYKLQRRIHLLRSDMFSALPSARYDLIIANPPYVDAHAMRKLPREYRHEPRIALAGGEDGLDTVRVILREAAVHLTAHGLLVVEVGHHRSRVEAAFPHHPFVWPQTSGGDDCVFILGRDDLLCAAARAAESLAAAPRPASRAGAASRRR